MTDNRLSGDKLTPHEIFQWWNDLWLNEGFASYVEYLGADYAEPTWNIVGAFPRT